MWLYYPHWTCVKVPYTHNRFTALWILSRTTRVSRYQKKRSHTHSYHGHQSSLISCDMGECMHCMSPPTSRHSKSLADSYCIRRSHRTTAALLLLPFQLLLITALVAQSAAQSTFSTRWCDTVKWAVALIIYSFFDLQLVFPYSPLGCVRETKSLPHSFIHQLRTMASSCSIHAPDSLFPQSLSKFSLVYLWAWHPPLHIPYISSPNRCLLFATHAHTIAACFTVVSRLCHCLILSQNWTNVVLGTFKGLYYGYYSSNIIVKTK